MNILNQYNLVFRNVSVFGTIQPNCDGNSALANFLDTTIYQDTLQEGIQRCNGYLNNQINPDGVNSINGEVYIAIFDTSSVEIYSHFGDQNQILQTIPLNDFKIIVEMWYNFIYQ